MPYFIKARTWSRRWHSLHSRSVFRFQVSRHQSMHRLDHVLTFIKHGIYFIQHRGAEIVPAAKLKSRPRGRVAFGHGHHARRDFRGLFATADAFAKFAIAAQTRKTRHHQVSQTTQTGKSL